MPGTGIGEGGGTNTSVSVSASANVTVLAQNVSRQAATVYNDGAATVYLSLGATASSTSHTVQLAPNDYYEVPRGPQGIYSGIITHQGSSATGSLRVTEI